jgi:hypothetical protein
MFEFRFCSLKFFWIQAKGFCKDWGTAAPVNVMLHPIVWGGHRVFSEVPFWNSAEYRILYGIGFISCNSAKFCTVQFPGIPRDSV